MSEQAMATCPTCGTVAPYGASFCGNCGASLAGMTPAAPPDGMLVSETSSRNWATGAHLTALAGAFTANVASFVGPLVIWLIRRDDDPFAAEHALEALNFNLMTLGIVLFAGFFGVLTLGLGLLVVVPLLLFLALFWLVWTIQAAIAASRGEPYRYPISIRLIQ